MKYQPQALLVRSVTKVNQSLLAGNKSVKFVGSATIGTDHIDIEYLKKHNIEFANAAGCSKHSVAQYVITAILSLKTELSLKTDTLHNLSNVDKNCTDIPNKQPLKIGIIGLGNIGNILASYAQNLGWEVLGYDPLLPTDAINNTSFTELLKQADIVSIHIPLTTAEQSRYPTHHLLDDDAFKLMKTDSILINSARGAVIKEQALLADIKRTNRKVVLDVFEHEPVVSSELLSLLAIVTPHIAGYTLEGKLRGTQLIYDAFCDYFSLSVSQSLENLLPHNPYQWQTLLNDLSQDCTKLTDYYDIMTDDTLLRTLIANGEPEVLGSDFDGLRKNYALRREWNKQ